MSADTFEVLIGFARTTASVLAAGIAIKLMDDFLDEAADRRTGTVTIAGGLGAGVLPYCMAALTVALLLERNTAAALFLGAYTVGMAHDPSRPLPTGLKGWHESLLATGIAVIGSGWTMATAGIASMLFVQCMDDILDSTDDRIGGQANLVNALGRVETTCLALTSLIVATTLAPVMVVSVTIGVTFIEGLVSGRASRKLKAKTKDDIIIDVPLLTVDNVPVVTVGKIQCATEVAPTSPKQLARHGEQPYHPRASPNDLEGIPPSARSSVAGYGSLTRGKREGKLHDV